MRYEINFVECCNLCFHNDLVGKKRMCIITNLVLPKEFCQSPEPGFPKYPDWCPLPDDPQIQE
jgi:hypothetical protein